MTLEIKEKNSLNAQHTLSTAVFALREISSGQIKCFSELENAVSHSPSVKKLLNSLQYNFCNPQFLIEALAHSSFLNEFSNIALAHNEQIEFLGDSVLNLLFTSKLINQYQNFSEGDLSKFRGSLINENSFYELALTLELGDCVLLGKGEIATQGMLRKSLLADALEALFGAIFKDGGYDAAQACFNQLLTYYKSQNSYDFIHIDRLTNFDAKTRLQEKTMELYKELPIYNSEERGTEGFHISLQLSGKTLAETISHSKKIGEKKLAKQILEKIQAGELLC